MLTHPAKPARAPGPGSRRRQWLAYLGCSAAMGVFYAFNNYTLTLWLTSFTGSYIIISLLGNSKSLEGAVVSPLVGRWSDRSWLGWLGRRRPFILVGGLLSGLFIATTPAMSRLPLPFSAPWLDSIAPGLLMAIVAIFLFTLTFNCMDDLHKALLADVAGPDDRDDLSGLAVTVEMVGQMSLLVLVYLLWKDQLPDAVFFLTGALVALGSLVTVLGVQEPEPAIWANERQVEAEQAGPQPTLQTFLSRYRPAVALCVIQFIYWAGVNAVQPLVAVYSKDILGASTGVAQVLPALMMLSTMLLAIPMGKLGDQVGKRKIMALGYLLITLAGLGGLIITTPIQGAAIFLLAGVGNAAVAVIQIPLLADLVPRQAMGSATGALAASGSVAAPLTSLVAGGLSDLYGPRVIFAMMAALVALALVLLPSTRADYRSSKIATSLP